MLLDNITDIYHPNYKSNSLFWQKWRLTYQSGDYFIQRYLQRFRERESPKDFNFRLALTYVPAFAKAALNDIKNSIFQRTIDITRENGPLSYQNCIEGLNGGVDLNGSSMSFFIGQKILPELLSMSKIGVFVDMPQLDGETILDKGNKRPYLYYYPIEDIQAWSCQEQSDDYEALILRDHVYTKDASGLPIGEEVVYRHIWLKDGQVYTRFYDCKGQNISETPIELNIDRIPFVILELSDSILADVANYQIALMNLASSDMFYALMGNYPFYTEQYDPRNENIYNSTTIVSTEAPSSIIVGPTKGRRYPVGLDRPDFIAPPSEPLKISMEKQQQLKEEIYTLVNLSVSNVAPVRYIAKNQDNQGLEAGLSYIGLVLENAERKIGEFWSKYEGTKPPVILYPETYSLPNSESIIKENDQDLALADRVPSLTFKKALLQRVAQRTIGSRVSTATLRKIESEIESAKVVVGDVDSITQDITNGLVSNKTASIARGYPENESELAKVDHAERLALIQAAQTPVNVSSNNISSNNTGVSDLTPDPNIDRKLKNKAEDTTKQVIPTDNTRGNGK